MMSYHFLDKATKSMKGNKEVILLEIDNLKKYGNLIVVEGEHDRNALEDLGLERIFILNKTGVSLFTRIEEITKLLENKESCVVLTDLDKKGKSYHRMIRKELANQGFRTNDRLRDMLFRSGVSHIEGLSTFLMPQIQPHIQLR